MLSVLIMCTQTLGYFEGLSLSFISHVMLVRNGSAQSSPIIKFSFHSCALSFRIYHVYSNICKLWKCFSIHLSCSFSAPMGEVNHHRHCTFYFNYASYLIWICHVFTNIWIRWRAFSLVFIFHLVSLCTAMATTWNQSCNFYLISAPDFFDFVMFSTTVGYWEGPSSLLFQFHFEEEWYELWWIYAGTVLL